MTTGTFDCFGNDVLDGRKLIESSAGTGKTYTIASLYVRLLVEKELQVGQILVVTFTKAATEELKGRIRKNLRDALSALEGMPAGDDFIRRFRDDLASRGELPRAAELLANALRMFDEAAIFTIHGFCGRVLKDNAFESASLFDTELVTEGSDLVEEIAADFYRRKIHGVLTPYAMKYLEDPLRHFVGNGLEPGSLGRFIHAHAGKPFLSILPAPEDAEASCRSIGAVEAAFEKAREEVVTCWRRDKGDIMALIGDGTLTRRSYTSTVREKMETRMDALADADPSLPDFGDIDRFRPSVMAEKNKGNPVPMHPFFDRFELFFRAAESLEAIYAAPVIAMRHELLAYANAELAARKRRKNIRFYDDLLQDLQKALAGPGRPALIERVRSRYVVGLIDEFQDTDMLQYEIFDAFFPAGSTLFLIGDPKQAIYSFRGADIFAYLKAAGNVEGRYSLGENFRSTPGMVRAVNALFGSQEAPFVFEQIDYPMVTASEKGKAKESTRGGTVDATPLRFRFMSRTEGYKPGVEITKDRANREIPADTASEIVRLLEDGRNGVERLDGKKVVPGDIAVLVRTNRQARDIHAALRRCGVPSVIYGSESVFGTREAEELQRVLSAVVDAGNDAKVRAALATAWFGVDCAGLMWLLDDEGAWTEWVLRFMGWRGEWASDGFVAMARTMMRQAGIRKRMLGLPEGDRRMTNLLHLFELMHQVEHEEGLGIEGLAAWLARRRAEAASDEEDRRASAEEHQLRLETDEMAVKVVTVHKSKGLEYPIVFCPYLWDVYIPKRGPGDAGAAASDLDHGVLCHDPDDTSRMVRDFGSPRFAIHAEQAIREDLSENARMLYVALTRAKYRCVVTWGAFKGAHATALAKLLHPEGMPDSDEGLVSALQRLCDRSGAIARETMSPPRQDRYVPESVEAREFACRSFSGRIDRDWGVSSFTSLVSGAGGKGEKPDRDEMVHVPASPDALRPPAPVPGAPTPFDFPKGAKSGLFFHALMESLDFAAGDEAIGSAVRALLPEYGLGPEWAGAASSMARNALSTPLDADDPGFILSAVGPERRRHEIEFGLSLGRLTLDSLRGVYPDTVVRQLSFSPVRGLMKGFIDLVFERDGRYFLLDWKTNHLGGRVEDYAPDALRRSMAESFYFLQSHLYTVAIDRYLSRRIADYRYDRHFGGIYYLYVRGLDPASGPAFGVHFDRPGPDLVSSLARRIKEGA